MKYPHSLRNRAFCACAMHLLISAWIAIDSEPSYAPTSPRSPSAPKALRSTGLISMPGPMTINDATDAPESLGKEQAHGT